jgi:hypothetical protein
MSGLLTGLLAADRSLVNEADGRTQGSSNRWPMLAEPGATRKRVPRAGPNTGCAGSDRERP